MLANRKPGIYYPFTASHLREAVVNNIGMKRGGFRFTPFDNGRGEVTFNDSIIMIKEKHDPDSWNFETGITYIDFNDGHLPNMVFSRIECMLGLPIWIEKGSIYIMLGRKRIDLPRSGPVPIRQILNNILYARGMPIDIGNHYIFHGQYVSHPSYAIKWFLIRNGEPNRTVDYPSINPAGHTYTAQRTIDRTTVLNISSEQGFEDEINQAIEFKLYF